MKLSRDIYPQTVHTIETWFGTDAPRLISEAVWSELMESWCFDYRKAFSSTEDMVTYYVDRDGYITFL
jgi:hypothetical protein